MIGFKKAEKKQAKLKIGMTGPSGSGKTYSALLLAKGMARPREKGMGGIAVIDTENDSASLYADRFDFDVCGIEAPYTTDKYLAAIKMAEEAFYDVIIIDSLTHQWAADGGILNRKAQFDDRGGNGFTNWQKGGFTPEHERFKVAILQSDAHMICTIRSKTDYVVTENDRGKMAPQKIGLAPIQREGMEYEFTLVFDVDKYHFAQATKDRTALYDKQSFIITEDHGKELMAWISSAKYCWKFGTKHSLELTALIKSFAQGRHLYDAWTASNGRPSELGEAKYNEIIEYLTTEATKAKLDPESFDNVV